MKVRNILGIMGTAVLALLLILFGKSASAETVKERIPVRIGWQVPTVTQAQIVQVLKRTNVLEIHGLEPRLVPFSFGTPEIEAALAGKLDVVFAGDQPLINLIARGGKWKIVARLYYDRVALMVPLNSPIRDIKELRGKKVASPFGSTGHREAIIKQTASGLNPDRDVRNENLDILEISRRVQSGGVESWGGIDAVAVWEPSVSRFEIEGLARSLGTARTIGLIAISDDFIVDHAEAAVQFLTAVLWAWDYLSRNADRVRQWYIDDIQLGYSPEVLPYILEADLNFRATSPLDIHLKLTDEEIAGIEKSVAWGKERGYVKGKFQIREAIDQSLLAEATKAIVEDRFEDIQVILPTAREAPTVEVPSAYFFDRFSIGTMFTLILLISFLSIESGQWLVKWRHRVAQPELQGPVGTVVAAVLGLLAFIIALTFAAASDRFDARKQVLLDEVNAIDTAYHRAGLIPEPHKTTTRSLLRDYVEIRLGMYRIYDEPEKLQILQSRTTALQESIWSHAEALADSDRNSPIYALFSSSLNEVFDLHTKRVVLGAEYRIPFFVWSALALVSCLAMFAVGLHFGIGGKRSLISSIALSLAFSLVILLIFDLDRPGKGLIEVNQQPMIELYRNLGKQG